MTKRKKIANKKTFEIKDCAIISQMGGLEPALNLRELRQRLVRCPIDSIFHHFCEPVIRPSFDDPEFRNDFAVWILRSLRDHVMAERLGILNPYNFQSFEELREHMIDLMDERLNELRFTSLAGFGDEFRFMRAVTTVFSTDKILKDPLDLVNELPKMSNSSIYYHFIDARRRTGKKIDDFSIWIGEQHDPNHPLIEAFLNIDYYFLDLSELRQKLIEAAESVATQKG